jgi:hypothetical protein
MRCRPTPALRLVASLLAQGPGARTAGVCLASVAERAQRDEACGGARVGPSSRRFAPRAGTGGRTVDVRLTSVAERAQRDEARPTSALRLVASLLAHGPGARTADVCLTLVAERAERDEACGGARVGPSSRRFAPRSGTGVPGRRMYASPRSLSERSETKRAVPPGCALRLVASLLAQGPGARLRVPGLRVAPAHVGVRCGGGRRPGRRTGG